MHKAIAAAIVLVVFLAAFLAYVGHRSRFKSTLLTERTSVGGRVNTDAALPTILGEAPVQRDRGSEPEQKTKPGNLSTSGSTFPVTQGTYRIYRGVIHYEDDRGNHDAEAQVTWKMEATRTVRRGNVVASVVKGYPADLNWSMGDAKARNSIIVIRDSKFYEIISPAAKDALKRLADPSDSLEDLASDDGCLFQFPLVQGNKCGPAGSVSREDGMYCWIVDGSERMNLSGITGLPQEIPQEVDSYSIAYRTLPDDTKIDFVPGIGIVTYEYHHHGTVADTALKLVEFHRADTR